ARSAGEGADHPGARDGRWQQEPRRATAGPHASYPLLADGAPRAPQARRGRRERRGRRGRGGRRRTRMNLIRGLLFDNIGLKLVALLVAVLVYLNVYTDRPA